MRVFVTGATGFVGGRVLRALLDAGHDVRALVRPGSVESARHTLEGVDIAEGDVLADDLDEHLKGIDAVIHLVGIIREDVRRNVTFERLHVEATANVIQAMSRRDVRRVVHMSALGGDIEGPTAYFRSKGAAEDLLRCSGLDWTVIRPSIIYGPGDSFVSMLARQVRIAPVVPVIGDGEYQLQPVWASDVAQGFVQALSRDDSIGRRFDVGGSETITYDELLDKIGAALGRARVPKIHLPLGMMRPIVRSLGRLSVSPITEGQLTMLLMNNTTDERPYFDFFDIEPTDLEEGLCQFLGPPEAECSAVTTDPVEAVQT